MSDSTLDSIPDESEQYKRKLRPMEAWDKIQQEKEQATTQKAN